MLGYMRRYKGIVEAVETFRATAKQDEFLFIAGPCHDDRLLADIMEAGRGRSNVRIHAGAVSPFEFASILKMSDLFLCNFSEILNSGSAISALSLGLPVVAPARGSMVETSELVGAKWFKLFMPPLTPELMREILTFAQQKRCGVPDLRPFEPHSIAQQHMQAYGLGP
jgi:glycosyltransferase involved in cell wall biosynthesis